MVFIPHTSERATRLCRISPTMAIFTPSSFPAARRIVMRSRSAWVGCSWHPSPAFTITAWVHCVRKWGTPGELCRTTTMSIFMASILRIVSRSDSPFFTELVEAEKLMGLAESRFSASSKEMRVRVLLS
jgi:hypothetical protein